MITVLLLSTGCLGVPPNAANSDINNENRCTEDLSSWVGRYYFEELWESPFNDLARGLSYTVDIYTEDSCHFAVVHIDGFQTLVRMGAKVVGNQKEISLLFGSYLPDNMWSVPNEGDLLLRFERKGAKIYTYWGAIKPVLPENETSGGVYFSQS